MSKDNSRTSGNSRKKKPRQGFTRDAELGHAAKQARAAAPTKQLAYQMKTLSDPLTHQDAAIAGYLHTLAEPWVEEPFGVPLLLGNFSRRTIKVQIDFEVTAIANALGFAFVAVNCDGWVGDQAAAAQIKYASYPTGVQGTPIWSSNASYVGAFLPAATATTAVAGLLSNQLPVLDGQVTSTSNIRMVAAGLRVFSDSAVNTAQGKLAIIATTRPYGGSAAGAVTLSNYATLSTMPDDLVSFQSEPCAGWKAGHVLRATAIPTDPTCFEFFNPPGAGTATFSYPQLAAVLSGGAPNQTFTAQIVYDYEFDMGMTYVTGTTTDPVIGTDSGTLSSHIATMNQVSSPIMAGPSGKPSLAAAQAIVAHTAMTRPLKLEALGQSRGPASSLFSGAAGKVFDLIAKVGVPLLAKAVKGIPYVGNVLSLLGF